MLARKRCTKLLPGEGLLFNDVAHGCHCAWMSLSIRDIPMLLALTYLTPSWNVHLLAVSPETIYQTLFSYGSSALYVDIKLVLQSAKVQIYGSDWTTICLTLSLWLQGCCAAVQCGQQSSKVPEGCPRRGSKGKGRNHITQNGISCSILQQGQQ